MVTFDLDVFFTHIRLSLLFYRALIMRRQKKNSLVGKIPPEQSVDCNFHSVPEDGVVIDVFRP